MGWRLNDLQQLVRSPLLRAAYTNTIKSDEELFLMPVIREKSQFGIGPIGVPRVNTAVESSMGSVRVAEAIAISANQMADMFFRGATQAAQQKGSDAALSVDAAKITMIDPVTGAPTAYEPPRGMGVIAQQAYQDIVKSRFQSSIESEIKLKASELAVKYDGSVDRYSLAMSEYIGAMAETADGPFKGLIVDIGTSYLNATRGAMTMDQLRKERAFAKEAHKNLMNQALTDLENNVFVNGLK
jgi:hypothetical protein